MGFSVNSVNSVKIDAAPDVTFGESVLASKKSANSSGMSVTQSGVSRVLDSLLDNICALFGRCSLGTLSGAKRRSGDFGLAVPNQVAKFEGEGAKVEAKSRQWAPQALQKPGVSDCAVATTPVQHYSRSDAQRLSREQIAAAAKNADSEAVFKQSVEKIIAPFSDIEIDLAGLDDAYQTAVLACLSANADETKTLMLNMSGRKAGDGSAAFSDKFKGLVAATKNFKQVEINANKAGIDAHALCSVLLELAESKNLKSLDLSGNPLKESGAQFPERLLPKLKHLEKLDISNIEISDIYIDYINEMQGLTDLVIRNAGITSRNVLNLGRGINLKSLDLRSNKFEMNDEASFGSYLRHFSHLEVLDIRDNGFSEKAQRAILRNMSDLKVEVVVDISESMKKSKVSYLKHTILSFLHL
ncbi:hypothetical protein QS306_13935 [Paraburkholderia bonniea]|uniref:leucine-rich repeat domain-containing protein n=1 Tax=Paraburkholderia bonniea TaxID=2152891 RepID=UPI002573D2E4|nr:hypothetical protein [Paraburkholderia bonniea]WJF91874.1 hypothetical protein QS306_13935 [Paraburkholderia bonniea]WJF95193.1 hypothetical protein QS308_13945 [Paraburkholderia bonniea]